MWQTNMFNFKKENLYSDGLILMIYYSAEIVNKLRMFFCLQVWNEKKNACIILVSEWVKQIRKNK